jgi:phosphatidylglycerophosphate synthase
MSNAVHLRWNEGFLRPLERPALAWLALNMPRWVTPDILTGIGLAGAVIACVGYALARFSPSLLWLATLGLVINWFGDSLDGTLARQRKIERPRYGYFLDHSIDCLAVLLLAIGIGFSGYVRFDICFLTLATFLMLCALTYLRAHVSNVFQMSYAAIGPTEIRVGLIALNAMIIFIPPRSLDWIGLPTTYPNLLAMTFSIALVISFVVCMIGQIRQLAIEEPAQQEDRRGPERPDAAWDLHDSPRTHVPAP